jgi:hypothetical protein
MDTLASHSTVLSECNLPITVLEATLKAHVESASIEVRKLFSEDVYTEIYEEDEAEQRRIECVKGESLLAFSYALPYLNIATSGKGIVSATGWDGNRSELMSVKQTQELAALVRAQAMELLLQYVPAADVDEDGTDDNSYYLNAGGFDFVAI